MRKKYEMPVMKITVFASEDSTNAIMLSSNYGKTITNSIGNMSNLKS